MTVGGKGRWAEPDGELQRNQETQQLSLMAAVSVVSSSVQTQNLQTQLHCVVLNTFMSGHGQKSSYLTFLKRLCTFHPGLPIVLNRILLSPLRRSEMVGKRHEAPCAISPLSSGFSVRCQRLCQKKYYIRTVISSSYLKKARAMNIFLKGKVWTKDLCFI